LFEKSRAAKPTIHNGKIMVAYQIVPGAGIAGLERVKHEERELAAGEVRVRVRAVALNYRDLMVAHGNYGATGGQPLIPCSDASGEVMATGAGVTRFKTGDRVASVFFPKWIEGEATPVKTAFALGGGVSGVLAEQIVLHEDALVRVPAHLDFVEAATLSCAGVTAWNALFVGGALKPGGTVLLLGTGGVSTWALQLAKAAGVRTIITSSSDEKLARARELGADFTINYSATPEWQQEVLRLTQGRGVDLVLEVGGHGTLARSIASARMGGTIAVIGGVSGFTSELQLLPLIGGAKRLAGVFVGSRAMHEQLVDYVEAAAIKPVVDRRFSFGEAREAYAWLDAGRHFGKVAIEVGA
jgi:NADPH:quinone reductase-like Zn-dependent oxidoreductase